MKKQKSKNTQLVYSTEKGRIDTISGKQTTKPQSDGIVRLRREVKGRRGKTVTTISGVPLMENRLSELAAELKRRCSTGGTVKDGVIILQGDHREALLPLLEKRGFMVKMAGG